MTVKTAANWCKVAVPVETPEGALTEEGELVLLLIQTAREWCEKYTGLSFGPKTLSVRLSQQGYAGPQSLPYGPYATVTEALDQDGNMIPLEQFGSTWYAEYLKGMSVNNTYKEDYGWGYGFQSAGFFGPDNTYTLTYTAGFPTGTLPRMFRQAVLVLVSEMYNNRDHSVVGTIVAELPINVKTLLDMGRKNVGII
ncbi:head-tail connector protein [Nibribacter koreensis]|uniref:head-tail connector protein n=1 Tax=Nibribacter koreensis TaxID=1084519 RepID=UPI0031F175BB